MTLVMALTLLPVYSLPVLAATEVTVGNATALADALDDIADGTRIILAASISDYTSTISLDEGKNITLDLAGNNLTIAPTTSANGISLSNGAKLTVTNTSTSGSELIIKDTVYGRSGIEADSGSTFFAGDDVTVTISAGGVGVRAVNGSTVTMTGSVTASATGTNGATGVNVADATATVKGDVSASTATGPAIGVDALANSAGAVVNIVGNVYASSTLGGSDRACGVSAGSIDADNEAKVTVDGGITSTHSYINLHYYKSSSVYGDVVKMAADHVETSSEVGYYEYNNEDDEEREDADIAASYVFVRDLPNPDSTAPESKPSQSESQPSQPPSSDGQTSADDDAPASTPPPAPSLWRVTASHLNERSGPGTQYPRVGLLPFGTMLEIVRISPDGRWALAHTGTWVSMQYLRHNSGPTTPGTPTATAPTGPTTAWTVNVSPGSRLNVRAAAAASGRIVGTLRRGDVVRVISTEGGWARIAYTAEVPIAYVSASYISR